MSVPEKAVEAAGELLPYGQGARAVVEEVYPIIRAEVIAEVMEALLAELEEAYWPLPAAAFIEERFGAKP